MFPTESYDTDIQVSVEHLTISYALSKKRRFTAVKDVSFEIKKGEIIGLVGESGSGKSTIGRAIAGFQRPTGGVVRISNGNGILESRTGNSGYRDVQMIFQESVNALDPRATIRKVVYEAVNPNPRLLITDSKKHSINVEAIRSILDEVGLDHMNWKTKTRLMSGGEKQRLAIARALIAGAGVLVCDEAVSALDVALSARIVNLLRTIRDRNQISILFISHDIAVVGSLADRMLVLNQGEVVEEGAVDDIIEHPKKSYTKMLIESTPRI